MHLTYILPPIEFYSPQNGGALATFAMQQGRRLEKKGFRISVIAPHEREEIYPVGQFMPLNHVTRQTLTPFQRALSTRILRRVSRFDWLYFEHYLRGVRHALQELQPDAALCFNDWQTPLAVQQISPRTRVFLRLSNECLTRARNPSRLVAVPERIFHLSNYIRDWTATHFAVPAEKFVSLPNGADLDSFFPESDHESRILDKKRPLKALFISRLDPNKGPDLALKAVGALKAQGANITLSVAGGLWFGEEGLGDPYIEHLKKLAHETDARVLGYVERPQVPQLVREHDVLLFPVRNNEPMSQVVFEAMASGLAVISCPLGGVPEACGEAALWAKPDDFQSLAACLGQLYSDRDTLLDFKRRSLSRANLMTWDVNAERFEAVLNAGPQ